MIELAITETEQKIKCNVQSVKGIDKSKFSMHYLTVKVVHSIELTCKLGCHSTKSELRKFH